MVAHTPHMNRESGNNLVSLAVSSGYRRRHRHQYCCGFICHACLTLTRSVEMMRDPSACALRSLIVNLIMRWVGRCSLTLDRLETVCHKVFGTKIAN